MIDWFARREFLAQIFKLSHSALKGVVPQQQVVRRRGRCHRLEDGLDGTHGVAWLFAGRCAHLQANLAGSIPLVLNRILTLVCRVP